MIRNMTIWEEVFLYKKDISFIWGLCCSLYRHRQKVVLGGPKPGSTPRMSLLFRPKHLQVITIAQGLLKMHLFLKLLAKSPLAG